MGSFQAAVQPVIPCVCLTMVNILQSGHMVIVSMADLSDCSQVLGVDTKNLVLEKKMAGVKQVSSVGESRLR